MNKSVVQAVLWTLVGGAVVTAFFVLGPFSSRLGLRDLTPTVRSYVAPQQMDAAMTDALRQALDPHGRVVAAPNDQLFITAPADIQEQIPKIIATIAASAQRQKLVRIDAWWVASDPERGQSAEDAAFEEIRPALLEIAKDDRAVRFQVRDRSSLEVVSGSAAKSQAMEVRPRLRKREDGKEVVAADLNLQDLKTSVQLVPGELAVIGWHTRRLQLPGQPGVSLQGSAHQNIYYIVRASL